MVFDGKLFRVNKMRSVFVFFEFINALVFSSVYLSYRKKKKRENGSAIKYFVRFKLSITHVESYYEFRLIRLPLASDIFEQCAKKKRNWLNEHQMKYVASAPLRIHFQFSFYCFFPIFFSPREVCFYSFVQLDFCCSFSQLL